jgi:hypothetical protein
MLRHKTSRVALAAAIISLGVAGCDDGTSPQGDASIRVLLTDAPIDYVASAWVDIGAVELIPANGDGPIVLTEDGTDDFVDLLDLQGAVTHTLADADIEAGEYTQIRLIVEAARVELAEGYEFNDGSVEKDLFIPSGAQTGIKLNLSSADGDQGSGPVTIAAGETVLVLDFDVSRSFVIQGNPETPAGINGMIFKPTLRVVVQDVAASISGTITTELEGVSLEGLQVVATPDDEGSLEEYQTLEGTATTNADGEYTIRFLVPGQYTVTVTAPDGLTSDPESVVVELGEDEDATDVDFALVGSGS